MSNLARIWGLLDRPTRLRTVFLFALMLVTSALEVAGIGLILPLLTLVDNPASVHTLPYVSDLYGAINAPSPPMFIVLLCGGIFLVFVVKNGVLAFTNWYQFKLIWGLRAEFASSLFTHYLHQPYAVHLQRNSATLLRNVSVTVPEVINGQVLPLVMLATDLLVAIAIVCMLLVIEPTVTLATVVVLGGTAVLFQLKVRARLRNWGLRAQDTNAEILRRVAEALGGIKVIKVLQREPHFAAAFAESARVNSDARRYHNFVSTLPRLVLEVLAVGAILAGIAIVARRGATAADLLPILGLFTAAAVRLLPAAARIAAQASNLRFNAAAVDMISGDLAAMRANVAPRQQSATLRLARDIALEGVWFRYPGSADDSLKDINLVIRRGESVGLVGPSGAGKTTLADVLLGLLKPTAGRVTIDGVDTGAGGQQPCVAYVPQDVFLIDDSLRRNVAIGLADSEVDEARLRGAVSRARLDDVVARLPQGIDAPVGERGVKLSGGQRQRVGIARALYRDADILVLDEATSSLDAETESEVADAIARLHGERTLVIIAHRLSTVRNCDRLLYISEGRIVDSGSFSELLARNVAFRRMVQQMELTAGGSAPARLQA